MDEILEYLENEINLSNKKKTIISTNKIIDYFNDLNCVYDFDYLSNILIKSNKLKLLIEYIIINKIDIFNDMYPISDFIIIYEIKNENNGYIVKNDSEELDIINLYLSELPKKLTDKQEKMLLKKIHTDESVKRLFIESNLKLVAFIAKKYNNKYVPFLDLVQEGNLGLIKAVELFDVDKNVKFSTYAVYWIKQYIKRAIYVKSKVVSLSYSLGEKIETVKHVINNYEMLYGVTPSLEELSKLTSLSIYKLKEILLNSENIVSLSTSLYDNNGQENNQLGDIIEDKNASSYIDDFIRNETNNEIRHELFSSNKLTDKMKLILALRFGLYDGSFRTQEEVGKIFGYTKANISRIEKKAFRILSKSKVLRELAGKEDYESNKLGTSFYVTKTFKKRYDA